MVSTIEVLLFQFCVSTCLSDTVTKIIKINLREGITIIFLTMVHTLEILKSNIRYHSSVALADMCAVYCNYKEL